MKKIAIIIASIIGFCVSVQAQQEIMISQYMFNSLVLNPAYAGSHPYWSASALVREQWVQMEGRPRTQTFCVDGPVANRKFGVGLNFSNDMLGIVSQQEIGLNGSAKVQTSRGSLAAGIRVTGALYSTNTSRNNFDIIDTQDPVYQNNFQNVFIPKVGLGLYYYEKLWFAGISMPTIVTSDKKILPNQSTQSRFFKTHTYLNAGFVWRPSLVIAVKPSILVKYQQAAPMQVDLNCNVMFFDKFWLGLGYRTGANFVGMAEWNITSQLRVGYAYDYMTNMLNNYTNGSHEIMLGYDFGKDVDLKVRSPRYF
jgi:type IX secretion system PorP/SprF family membrane protein